MSVIFSLSPNFPLNISSLIFSYKVRFFSMTSPQVHYTRMVQVNKCIHFKQNSIQLFRVNVSKGEKSMKIGFIGLGIMGAPMVRNLLKGNHTVYVNDLNEEAVEMAVTHGATAVASLQEMAEHAEAFITMLPNGAIVKSVLLDAENGLYPYLKDGQAVVDMSSLTPTDSIEIGAKLEAKNVIFADAPVSGGEPLAITGELSVMVGCRDEHFERIKEIVASMSK